MRNTTEIEQEFENIYKHLENKQIKCAIDQIKLLQTELWNDYKIPFSEDQINNQLWTYNSMIQYLAKGANDPKQKQLYRQIIANIYNLTTNTYEQYLLAQSHRSPYGIIRKLFSNISIDNCLNNISLATDSVDIENNEDRLFLLIIGLPSSQIDIDLLQKKTEDNTFPESTKVLIISAVFMGLLSHFNEEKILFLINACKNENEEISQRALTALLPIMAKYEKENSIFACVKDAFISLLEDSIIINDLREIILHYIRTNETDAIVKEINEAIIPEMQKVADKFKNLNIDMFDEESDEPNPDWQEAFQNEDINDNIKRIIDLQTDGSDIYMSTFSSMKNFSFFNKMSNWFRAFKWDFSLFKDAKWKDSFVSAIVDSETFCNSDKFSFCLMLNGMPTEMQSQIAKSFAAEKKQLDELKKEDHLLQKVKKTNHIAKSFILDVYRFFKLNQHQKNYPSPFDVSLQFHKAWFWMYIPFSATEKMQIAEFYFSKKYYSQAVNIFEEIEKISEHTLGLTQKIGYCYQKMGLYNLAIEKYKIAELLTSKDEFWTTSKLAYCYRRNKNWEKALEYYQKQEKFSPENPSIVLWIGNCLLELEQYENALKYFFKADYLKPDQTNIWRAIAWTEIFLKNEIQAENYYKKIFSTNDSTWQDAFNYANLLLTKGDKELAFKYYETAYFKANKNISFIENEFITQTEILEKSNFETDLIPIILDYLRSF